MSKFFQSLFSRQVNYYIQQSLGNPYTPSTRSVDDLVTTFHSLSDVYIIENFISRQFSKIPVAVYIKGTDTEVTDTPLNRLIERPNYHQSWQEMIAEHSIWLGVTGNAYLYGDNPTGYLGYTSLYSLPSNKISVVLANDPALPEFQNYVAAYNLKESGTDYTLPAEQIMHQKSSTLFSDNGLYIYGVSPYLSAVPNLDSLEAIYSARISIIKDRGALGILSNESEIPDKDESKQVKDKLTKYGLLGDQDKIVVTTQKLNWQQMSMNVGELQLLENQKYDFNQLCKLRSIDPLVFSSEGSTYANQEQAYKSYINNVLIPNVTAFYKKLSEWLSPDYEIRPDFTEMQDLSEEVEQIEEPQNEL